MILNIMIFFINMKKLKNLFRFMKNKSIGLEMIKKKLKFQKKIKQN